MFNQLNEVERRRLFTTVLTVLILLGVYIGVQAVNGIKQNAYIGRGTFAEDVISIAGTGEIYAVPDTGDFSFSVMESGKTVAIVQDAAGKKINAIIAALKSQGVAEKDIKTIGYNSYPKYEYSQSVCPRPADGVVSNYYCPPGKQSLTGYEVDQTIEVKVRKTDQAGDLLTKVGEMGASNISGLNFVIDDLTTVQGQARDKAISDAKSKAAALSKSLGVKLVKIVNFEESNNGGGPIYYASDAKSAGMGTAPSAVPETPMGQNKITSYVTITYEVD